MNDYNYLLAVEDDVREYIKENIDLSEYAGRRDALESYLNDALFVEDSVTGNASGSYTFNAYKAETYLCHNWDILADAIDELCCDTDILRRGPEACDVTIRCYLLPSAISSVLDDLESAGNLDAVQEKEDED